MDKQTVVIQVQQNTVQQERVDVHSNAKSQNNFAVQKKSNKKE